VSWRVEGGDPIKEKGSNLFNDSTRGVCMGVGGGNCRVQEPQKGEGVLLDSRERGPKGRKVAKKGLYTRLVRVEWTGSADARGPGKAID